MTDIDRLLRDSLRAEADAFEPANLDAAETRFMQKRARRRLVHTGGAGLLAAAAAVSIFALVQPDVVNDRKEQGPQPAALQVADRYPVAEEPLSIAAANGEIWIASRAAGVVSALEPSTGEITEHQLDGASQVVIAGGSVWAAGPRQVMEIESEDGSGSMIVDFPPDVVDMAATDADGPVWLVTSSGCVADVTDMTSEAVCKGPFHTTDVASTDKETWLLDGASGDLNQLQADPGVNRGRGVVDGDAPIATAPAGRYADLLLSTAGGRDVLWASGEGARLLRLDLEAGESTTLDFEGDYIDLAEGQGAVWALVGHEGSDRGDLLRLDAATGEPIGPALSLSGKPSDVAADVSGVWVTLRETNEVVRITDVDAEPLPVETPDPEPTSTSEENGTKEAADAVVVFSKGGDIWAARANGSLSQLTDTDIAETEPVFTKSIFDPKGQAVLFSRGRGDRAGTGLVYLDLSTLEESKISEGGWPTFYPDGTGAWLSRDGAQPEIVVAPLFSEPIVQFPVAGTSDPSSVGPLAWDQVRESLFYAVAERNGPQLYRAEVFSAGGSPLDEIEPQLLEVAGLDDGDVLVAPAMSFSEGVDIIRLSEPSPAQDDGSYDRVELGTVDLSGARPTYVPIADLSHLPFAMDIAPARMTLANGGELAASVEEDGSVKWSRGDQQSWLVGDGFRLFLVDAAGGSQELPFEAGSGASVSFDYLPRD